MKDEMTVHIKTDPVTVWRAYIDSAVSNIADKIHPETGLYHFHHDQYSGVCPVSAPLLENFMVVLLLLRSRNQENISKAKLLLERLLYFCVETEHEASFPKAIHEFPIAAHPSLILGMLSVLIQIKRDFSVLGHVVIHRIQMLVPKLFVSLHDYFLSQPSFSGLALMYMLLEVMEGRRSEESFLEAVVENEWLNEKRYEDLRLLTQLVILLERTSEKLKPVFQKLFSELMSLFHVSWKKSSSYGVGLKYFRTESVSTVFEYYVSAHLGVSLKPSYVDPFLLDLAWIDPHFFRAETSLPVATERGVAGYISFSLPHVEVRAVLSQPKSNERQGFAPIRLITKHASPVFAFFRASMVDVTQEGNAIICSIESDEDALDVEPLVQFYLETSLDNVKVVSGKSKKEATFFRAGEDVVVSFDDVSLLMHVECIVPPSWSLSRGNRSGQLERKTDEGKIGFDWLIAGSTTSESRPKRWTVRFEVLA